MIHVRRAIVLIARDRRDQNRSAVDACGIRGCETVSSACANTCRTHSSACAFRDRRPIWQATHKACEGKERERQLAVEPDELATAASLMRLDEDQDEVDDLESNQDR